MPNFTHKFGAKVFVGISDKIRDSRLKKANEGLTPYQIRSRLPYFRLTLFDEAIHVPLLFLGKSIPKNKIIPHQVSNVDIFPTILDLIGISDKLRRDGRSLTSYFNDKVISGKEVYLHTIPYDEKSLQDKVGVRTSKYKYFRHARNSTVNVNLYDLKTDPFENNNIADDNSNIVKKMENILEELTENSTIESIDNLDDERSKKIQDELRLLGYKKTWKEKSN
jgi:arylsulfatase A-like enzyme